MKKMIWTSMCLLLLLAVFSFQLVFPTDTTLTDNYPEAYAYLEQANTPLEKLDLLEILKTDHTANGEAALRILAEEMTAIGYMANLILAELHEKKGENPAAFYQKSLSLYEDKDIQLKLAETLYLRGDSQGAKEIFQKMIPDYKAIESMIEIGIENSVIADMLLEGDHLNEALDFLEENIPDTAEEDLNKLHALVLADSGEYSRALDLMEEMIDNDDTDLNLRWWYGRSLEAVGKKNQAMKTYKDLGKTGAYRLGILMQENGQLEEAAAAFIESDSPMSRWRGARILDDLNKQEEALHVYYELAKEESSYQEDAAYRAYILQNQLSQPIASELLKVLENSPAWMVTLGKEPIWDVLVDVDYMLPEFLSRVEDYEEAEEDQMAAIEKAIGEKHATNAEKLGLGVWYQQQGQYYMSVRWGIRALREKNSRQAYELTYQKPFENEVLAAAEEFEIDPYLIWAVMREESHYRPDVFSIAGAQGLMQIMPATGEDIANRLRVSYTNEDMLNPEKNIRFGTFYLRSMLNMFSGDIDKALAAYNGGPGNVRKWSGTSIGSTPEGFPTSIAFMETRRYITKVRNTYYTYLWLYED
ncbi:Lytic transglycosylase, catalytic [Alkaliphilus metalliredigens QYMF]|uniref:Lytic transglycosylase, catalytic n=1 Tax=Alkaliphilus metalliredigens (strain QYMF) TaxID=293826 RepID=A6TPV1_ALKMQ|nr:lytic transglycosylase domain-containing protein [Alkaliphilus metalliredigens]ABR48219.1 Lytic transglycosylase, catalytic [Alkaliphilus metalliredigens QYMF]